MGCMVLKNLNHSNFTPNIISRRMISVVSLFEGRGRGGRDRKLQENLTCLKKILDPLNIFLVINNK